MCLGLALVLWMSVCFICVKGWTDLFVLLAFFLVLNITNSGQLFDFLSLCRPTTILWYLSISKWACCVFYLSKTVKYFRIWYFPQAENVHIGLDNFKSQNRPTLVARRLIFRRPAGQVIGAPKCSKDRKTVEKEKKQCLKKI